MTKNEKAPDAPDIQNYTKVELLGYTDGSGCLHVNGRHIFTLTAEEVQVISRIMTRNEGEVGPQPGQAIN